MQYDVFLRNRLAELRIMKGVSARDMSLSLGQSESYINKIENGKALPSMEVFFYICDYFEIRPQDFFAEHSGPLLKTDHLIQQISNLDAESLAAIQTLVDKLQK